jgi:modulator of FtsH protease
MISGWSTFFAAQTGAFAALTGLVFVALSINLKEILNAPGLPGRAGEAIIVLVEPVLVGLAGLLPHQSTRSVGVELLVIGVAGWGAVTAILVRGRGAMSLRPANERATRIVAVQGGTLPVITAGALLTAGVASGLYWQAAGTGVLLVAGMVGAWVLLVEILR